MKPRSMRSSGGLRLVAVGLGLGTGFAALAGVGPAAADDLNSGGRSQSSGNCTMYANGAGMGSYCTSATAGVGGGPVLTLRQRFGGQSYDRCHYDEPLPGVAPTEVKNEHGRWMLRSCLANIDLDTYDGGEGRTVSLSVVWIEDSVDTSVQDTPLSEFLWDTVQTQYPVPIMTFEPSHGVARVAQPAFATFRWSNAQQPTEVIAQGPYSGLQGGGPYVQEANGDQVTMTAQATKVTLDPAVAGEQTVECTGADVNPTYDTSKDILDQGSDCVMVFNRSSANADALADNDVPSDVPNTFIVKVIVTWRVSYQRNGGGSEDLGNFDMVVLQPVAVRDVDALNVPLVDWSLL